MFSLSTRQGNKPAPDDALVHRGICLQVFTIAWNCVEGVVSLTAGAIAGSVSLVGFGLDSFIEVASASAGLWRVRAEVNPQKREQVERRALRIVGLCFVALALFLLADSSISLIHHAVPEHSAVGVGITAASLVIMPMLARRKRQVARSLTSAAVASDARQTDFCVYLSAITLFGLATNAWLGWWWADSVAALIMVPIIAHEGVDALGSKRCNC